MSRLIDPYSVAGHSRTFPGAFQDLLHDSVAVLLPAGQREHDVEPLRLERKKGLRIDLRHLISIYINIYMSKEDVQILLVQ